MKSLLNYRVDNLFKEFNSDPNTGLSLEDHQKNIEKYGPNHVNFEDISIIRIFLNQFNIFEYLLLFASIFSFIRGEMFDGFFILFFISFSVLIGFTQEYKSKKTIDLLNKEVEPFSLVLRQGHKFLVKRRDLVPGDIIFLKSGDIVPADVKVIVSDNLVVGEDFLNSSKNPHPDKFPEYSELFFENQIIKGTCTAIVVYTGNKTKVASLNKQINKTRDESLYEKETKKLSDFIFKLVSITLTTAVIYNYFYNLDNFYKFLIFAISLGISVIPEALPFIVTYSLANGAQRLYKNKVLVRKLTSIEDLGAIEVLCTDKTGTLTENQLRVSNHLNIKSSDVLKLAYFTASKSTDPFDLAINTHTKIKTNFQEILDIPFDSNKRSSSKLIFYRGRYILITKGSYESIFRYDHISQTDRNLLEKFNQNETLRGNRVLLIGFKYLDSYSVNQKIDETGITIAGGISFEDPIKYSSFDALKKAQDLGLGIRILTGDSKETSFFVAKQFGLVEDISEVLNYEEILNFPKELRPELILKSKVISRVNPQEKAEVINILKTKYNVGYLGEGVNDVYALGAANLGIAVSNSVDIAKDASDIILTRKSLNVLIDGILEGRRIFYNISKYIKITISANFGNYFAMLTSTFFTTFLPLKPIQILLLTFISDVPLMAVTTDNVDKEELKNPIKSNFKELVKVFIIMGLVSSMFDFGIFFYFLSYGETTLQSVWFFTSVLTEIFVIFSLRTNRFFFNGSKPSSTLIWVSILMLVSTLSIVYVPFISNLFGLTHLSLNYLGITLGIAVTYLLISEIVKVIIYKKTQKLV